MATKFAIGKSVTLFTCLLFLTLAPFVGAQEVQATLEVPSRVEAGQEIPVRVTIQKGRNNDFARFQQTLPAGFDATPVNLGNADFTFKDHVVDVIWLKLPENPELVIEYSIKADARLTGLFEMQGRFSYIVDNDRDEVRTPMKKIEIAAPGTISETPQRNPVVASAQHKLAVFRDKPVMAADGSGYIVHLLVSRAQVEKLARIEENIPTGFVAENVDGKGAIFSFKNGQVKYIWMTLPEDPLFVVTYRIRPVSGMQTTPVPEGILSYMQNNAPATIPILDVETQISPTLDGQELEDLYARLSKETALELVQKGVSREQAQIAPSEGAKSALDLLNEDLDQPATGASENKPGQKTEIVTHKPEPREGIYFRVQIIATSRPIEIEEYFRKHNIPGKIYREHIGGLYKYTTGSFELYREARGFIDELFRKTDLEEAFVTAYRGSNRIPVKEALDATGQKWFR